MTSKNIKNNIFAGFCAGSIQTFLTFPIKTVIKYQYTTGFNIKKSIFELKITKIILDFIEVLFRHIRICFR